MTPLEADRPLLDAFRRGERAALERVFLLYADEVARQVRAARVSAHDVESVVQDVFIKAFGENARQSYDGLRPYGAWLNTITKNLLVDRARKERRIDLRAPDQMPVLVADEQADADFDERELSAALESFRKTLTPDEATLFRVRFEDGQSLPQAAKTLGWSEIKVRKGDTALRTHLLAALRSAGFLANAKVKIGTSLLGRRTLQKAGTPP
jgi:RNA polymerase sigma-70 factor (ECF subfamily)